MQDLLEFWDLWLSLSSPISKRSCPTIRVYFFGISGCKSVILFSLFFIFCPFVNIAWEKCEQIKKLSHRILHYFLHCERIALLFFNLAPKKIISGPFFIDMKMINMHIYVYTTIFLKKFFMMQFKKKIVKTNYQSKTAIWLWK